MTNEPKIWISPTSTEDWWTDREVENGQAPGDAYPISQEEFNRRRARPVHARYGIMGHAYPIESSDIVSTARQAGAPIRIVKDVIRPDLDTIGYKGHRITIPAGTAARLRSVLDAGSWERPGDISADVLEPTWALVYFHADEFEFTEKEVSTDAPQTADDGLPY